MQSYTYVWVCVSICIDTHGPHWFQWFLYSKP